MLLFFFSRRRRHTRWPRDWSSDVCSSDLGRSPRLPLEITLGQDLSSVTAVMRGGKRGERPVSVLLRADMDALAVKERTGSPFASTNDYMHACGHDLHTAALVGAAHILSKHREEIAGDVIFMFQPGEEGPGGARSEERRVGTAWRRRGREGTC